MRTEYGKERDVKRDKLCKNIQCGKTQSLLWKGSLFSVTSTAEARVADRVRRPDFTFASLQETTKFLVSAPLPAPFKPFVILDTGLFFPFTLIFQFLPCNIFLYHIHPLPFPLLHTSSHYPNIFGTFESMTEVSAEILFEGIQLVYVAPLPVNSC